MKRRKVEKVRKKWREEERIEDEMRRDKATERNRKKK
jgi:hypothetical protein